MPRKGYITVIYNHAITSEAGELELPTHVTAFF